MITNIIKPLTKLNINKLSKVLSVTLPIIALSLVTNFASQATEQSITNIIKDEYLARCLTELVADTPAVAWHKLKKVKCHGKHIKQLDGLTVLTDLEHLSLFNNQLKVVDISSFKKLKFVNISNNQLVEVKLSGLSELTTLYLFKNKLRSINLTGLGKLKKIRITNNQLVDINISALTSLEKAYFFDNKLEDLVLAGLTKLKFIELRQNPMPDEVYDRYDEMEGITIIHDGNADDWK
ncbi:hypothetical protein CMT41_17700 [Colwellia sp. MT41]|uniref:Internalin-A n=1 Tax=Colwellia marinimaniae TaxID=1513592 RepID=A0ABQ0MXW0_9GAMM|nr:MULTISPECIES: leucine-rich repeat domain-containing protein [Colwellia]ALO36368.1 hypothetical protein CMT41_17700 [Colwellia sp. MT41]GAW97203.1 internalin-A [Colwellia marinimaniae]